MTPVEGPIWIDIDGLTRIGNLIPNMNSALPLSRLDGLTVWHQARLEEEDIENTFNMANADVMDLMLSTKLPPERIMDWVDQGILCSSVGAKTKHDSHQNLLWTLLESLSIKNATGLEEVLLEVENPREVTSASDQTMPYGAPLKISPENIQHLRLLHLTVRSYHNLDLVRNWKSSALRGS